MLLREISACTHCAGSLPLGPRPVVRAGRSASLLIIGQAPGTKVHETGIPWNDPSGDRLRSWTGLPAPTFYDPDLVAIMPMGFCYPGRLPRGGDSPPRPECAPLWHHRLRAQLPGVKLTLLVGQYAQKAYLKDSGRGSMTETVRSYGDFLPDFFPLPHPSWRTTGWIKRNPWFEAEILPALRLRVSAALEVS